MAELNQNLKDWINEGWGDYVNRSDGNPLPYDQWFANELSLLGIDPSADVSGYTATGQAGDVQREFAINNSGGEQVYSKAWEDDPDWTAPYLALAGFAIPALAVGAGLAGAGAAGTAGAGGAGGLAAAESGLTALGSAWSPSALGLTGAITPGITAAELASLSAALPEIGAGLGAAGGISTLGGGSSGVTSLGSAMSPEALGLTGGITPGVTAGELAALSQPLPGAVTVGGGSFRPSDNYGEGMTGVQTSAYDNVLDATGSKGAADVVANSSIGSGLLNGVKSAADLVGGGSNLAGLIGAVAGGASGGGNTTATTQSQIDPRMAQYLYGTGYGDTNSLLGAAQQYYQQNKSGLNDTMQQGLDMQRAALQDPAYGQAFTQMRSLGTGLMGHPVAGNPFTAPQGPTAQAGGSGGLLGGAPSGRALSLISRGRGLLG